MEGKKWTGRWVEEEDDPGVDDKRVLAQEAELSRYFQVMQRTGDTLSETLRKLWDEGSAASRARTSRARCTGAHVSIVGHVPIDELRSGLTRTQAANGFANRFLWILVRRSKSLPFGGKLQQTELLKLGADTADAVRAAQAVGRVKMDYPARRLWIELYDGLSEGRAGLLGAILARGEAHVIRLALIYALADGKAEISVEHLQVQASRCGGTPNGPRCSSSVTRSATRPPTTSCANYVSASDGMTRTEIRQLLGGSYAADRIQAALDLLRMHRLAYMTSEESGGRPTERWRTVKPERAEAPAVTAVPNDPEGRSPQ